MTDANIVALGDIDGDGNVSNADFQAFLTDLTSGVATHAAVPEPASIVLLALAAPLLIASLGEYKRRRAEEGLSPWTIKGDLATLRSVFGKWLGKQCGLLDTNPFAGIKPPRCDDPDKRIIASDELAELFAWLNDRWHNWRLPIVYLEVASYTGWRATEIASLREEDLLPDGHLRVSATSSKTRKAKYGWLPADLYADLKSCAVDGSAFGKFAGELQRRLLVVRRQPGHAARVKSEFSPDRLVGWLQDELQRFNDAKAKEAAAADPPGAWEPFTLHNFRDTVITDSQAAGMSEKETGLMVGAGVEVMRKHYDKFNGQRIAKQSVELRLRAAAADPAAHSLRAACARAENNALDTTPNLSQTQVG